MNITIVSNNVMQCGQCHIMSILNIIILKIMMNMVVIIVTKKNEEKRLSLQPPGGLVLQNMQPGRRESFLYR